MVVDVLPEKKLYKTKEETRSSTVSTESMFLYYIINNKIDRDVET